MQLNQLPKECLLKIFQYLPLVDVILGVRSTCSDWYKLSFNGVLWKTVNLNNRNMASRMSDGNFLNLLRSVSDSVEEIIFGYSPTISEVSILHEEIHCPNLVSIDLRRITVDASVVEKFLTKYPRMEKLSLELTLADNCTQFLEFFQNQDFSCLKTLSIIFKLEEDCDINLQEGQEFEEVLSKNPTLCNLNSLLVDAIVPCTSLQCFTISFSYLSGETLYKILSATKQLTHLNIAGCWYVTGKALNALTPDCGLVNLNMDDTSVTDDAIKVMAERCHRLRSVSLENCLCITDKGVSVLAQNCPSITDFSLNHRIFNENTFDDLTGGSNKQSVRQDFEKMSVKPFLNVTDVSILSLVNYCHNLSKLGLAGCMALTDQAVEQIACSCPYLTLLNLSACMQVSDRSVESVLQKCQFLEILFLRNCINVTKLTFPGTKTRIYSSECDVSNDAQNVTDSCDNVTRSCEPEVEAAEKIPDQNKADCQLHQQCLRKQDFKLTILNLNFCTRISDTSLMQIAHNCPWLRKLFLCSCIQITDSGVGAIAKMCPLLNTLDISGWSVCHGEHMQLTDNSLMELSVHSQYLSCLVVVRCMNITVKGICAVLSKCSKLRKVCISTGVHFKIRSIALHSSLQKIEAYTSLKNYKDSNQDNFVVLELYPYNKRLL
ncbi:dynein regulatory complex subunit 6-like [Octopus sinensis]|uniref:Dynein regulatory complex subunit 6-like n=1 Tax=Octopus sinensis TaxID=2607531 RepID=A0A7E6FSJ7_9MOLL|nr:dynein regulatory complex subunit 6-like [Octopus sinensis]XP_036370573.1 dynein regulatory complex subunit 6-like [Octopus sinensis]XP_036370574.1 dynein regulatory complex subunit 6-like [Octopus sinensis]